MRKFSTFYNSHPATFFKKLLFWSKDIPEICLLNSNNYRKIFPFTNSAHSYDILAAIGSLDEFRPDGNNWLSSLERFINQSGDWLFGHLSYDLKNEIEVLSSGHPDNIEFPLISFFRPKYIFIINKNKIQVGWQMGGQSEEQISDLISEIQNHPLPTTVINRIEEINAVFSMSEYIDSVYGIKSHIQKGDIYEVNFCQEFFSKNVVIDPLATWLRLIKESPTPFSCFYRHKDNYLLCASPERFIKKSGTRIVSQPIKGTSKRGKNIEEDFLILKSLSNDPKERAENIMITDLVRNDLSKIASKATVRVNELCSVYPFPGIFQMQSDISAELSREISFTDIIKATFPMGSMTGAPKIRAMEIIEQYEKSKRGLYSGTIGYITPEMDFDFNVVIRSIQYNQSKLYLSYMVGGAITSLSEPEKEYQECLIKAKAITNALGHKMNPF